MFNRTKKELKKATSEKQTEDLEHARDGVTVDGDYLVDTEINTILAPIDFSECSPADLNFALATAKQFDAKLLLLHVIHDPAESPGFYMKKQNGKNGFRDMRESAQQMMDSFIQKHVLPFKGVESFVISGLPAMQILNFARKHQVDLIAIGPHRRSRLQRLMRKSVTDKVIHGATCPVLVVPEQKSKRIGAHE